MTLGVSDFPNPFIRVNGFFVCFTYQASCRVQNIFFFSLLRDHCFTELCWFLPNINTSRDTQEDLSSRVSFSKVVESLVNFSQRANHGQTHAGPGHHLLVFLLTFDPP